MNDTRFLSSLNLTSKAKDALAINGYQSVQDLLGVQPQELADELGLTLPEAAEILSSFSSTPLAPSQGLHPLPPSSSYSVSASQLLSRPLSLPIISTLSSSVDSLLLPSFGVQQGMIVEIAGGPGVGKTSALIGLAMDARRAVEARRAKGEEGTGGGGEVLIVDTEGSIDLLRLEQAARSVARTSPTPVVEPSALLQGIHLSRIHTLPQFISFFMTLESFLQSNPKISLILIDTLSHPIRSPAVPPDGKSKGRIVALIKATLQKCSALFEVAIITSVQLATKFVDSEGKPGNFDPDSRAILTPQLGESYMPLKTQRILLFFGGGSPTNPDVRRYATTLASPNPNPNANSSSSFSSSPFPSQHQQRGGWSAGMNGMGSSLVKGGNGNGWGGGGKNEKSQAFGAGGEEKDEKEKATKKWARFEISDEGLFRDVDLKEGDEDERAG